MPAPKQNDKPKEHDERNLCRSISVEVVERAEGDDAPAVVRASFSSETPILERAYWNESYQQVYRILDHSPGSVDLSRVQGGMCIEDNHYGDQIGIAAVELAERKLSGPITFGASERASVIERDAISGIRRNLSIWATVDPESYKLDGEQDGIPVLRVMAWQPLSAAFVNVQADPNVGVGRELDQDGPETPAPEKIEVPNIQTEETARSESMTPEEKAQAQQDIVRMYTLARSQDIDPKEVAEAVDAGKSYAEFSDMVLARVKAPKQNEVEEQTERVIGNAGMTDKEVKSYSIIRAINSMIEGKSSFEREVSDEVAKRTGKPAAGIYLPHEVLTRDLTTVGSGGNLVDTQLLSGSFIDMLRSSMVLDNLGVVMLGGLQGDISIPKQSGAATGYWVAENGTVTESEQTLVQVAGKPHTCGALTDISRRMRLQSSIDAEAFVQRDLAEVLGRTIQTAAFAGTGVAGQPKGLANADDLNAGTITTPGSATWADILTFIGLIMADNLDPDAGASWVMRPLVWANLAGLPKVSAEATFILETATKTMAGYPYKVTTGIPAKSMFFGMWPNMVLGMWGGLDLTIDTSTGSNSGAHRIVALQDVDVMVRNGQAFSYNAGVIA